MSKTAEAALLRIIEQAEYALQEIRKPPPPNARKGEKPSRKPRTGSSRYYGVSWCKHANAWKVRVGANSVVVNVGHFKSEIDAAKAYDAAAIRVKGPDAVLNFPKAVPGEPEPVTPARTRRPERKRLGFTGT